jgi:hypothetical protein
MNNDTAVERAAAPDDEGSALLMALVIITVIGLILSAVLSFTDTSLISTPAFVANRDTIYNVDGAVDGAINSIRGSSGLGTFGFSQACGPFQPYAGTPLSGITVDCTPQAGSGQASDEVPQYAILTLGTGSEGLIETGNDVLTVDGGVYSHGTVDLTSSGSSGQRALQVYGDLLAQGVCNPVPSRPQSITSVGGLKLCSPTFTGDARGDDPAYPAAIPDTTTLTVDSATVDPVATCATSSSIVAFSPGLYSEIPVAPSGCNGSVFWFQPGVYYFDFPDARSLWQPSSNAAQGHYLIAGTLSAGLSASTNSSVITANNSPWVGKACDKNAAQGVEFIMGGATNFSIDSGGYLELCSSKASTNYLNQQIALYGLNNNFGAGPRVPVAGEKRVETGTPTSQPCPVLPATTPPCFANANPNAKLIDGTVSKATLFKSNGNDTASVTLPAFEKVPAGSTITNVQMKIRHYEGDAGINPSIDIFLPNSNQHLAPSINSQIPLLGSCLSLASLTDCSQTFDLTSSFTGAFGYKDLNGLSAVYTAKLNGPALSADASLDGIEFTVSYTPPGFEKVRCPVGLPSCSVVSSTVSQNLFFHGTVYVPTGALNLVVHNKDTTIFDRGVVARTLTVSVSAGSKQQDSPFQLPKATTGRKVLFVGKVNGVDKIRALVTYQDFADVAGVKTAFAGYRVDIQNWNVLR